MPLPRTPLRHPKLRAVGIEVIRDRAPEVFKEIIDSIWYMTHAIPEEWWDIVKPEICGSSVFMLAKPWSDFDVNLAVDDWRDLHQLDYVRRATTELSDRSHKVSKELGIMIQIASRTISVDSPHAPKDLTGKYPIYSVREGKFYGKKDYEVFNHTLKWNKPTKWWEVVPPKNYTAGFSSDPYADEVPKWRELYGEYFIDVEPYVVHTPLEV